MRETAWRFEYFPNPDFLSVSLLGCDLVFLLFLQLTPVHLHPPPPFFSVTVALAHRLQKIRFVDVDQTDTETCLWDYVCGVVLPPLHQLYLSALCT